MEGDRHCFEYRLDSPSLLYFAVLSGRYAVRRERWRDVVLEIYHHDSHRYNLDRMMDAAKAALEYNSRAFGPYPYPVLRIVEFPRYGQSAVALAGTIPFSESIGFVARVREGDADIPWYVVAHEVAHQWWPHQMVGANAEGANVLSETLAQYCALMVMEKLRGREQVADLLRYELDGYLSNRLQDGIDERPLVRERRQPYLHYHKGALAMYALRGAIGESAVNAALRRLMDRYRLRGPPYATTLDLMRELRAVTPREQRGLLEDLFERITLYDNRILEASAAPAGEGRYRVQLRLQTRKFYADGAGRETETEFDDPIDLELVEASGRILYSGRHRVRGSEAELRLEVDGEPALARIDPLALLMDRDQSDNSAAVRISRLRPPPAESGASR